MHMEVQRKGTFLPRCVRYYDFLISVEALDEVHKYLNSRYSLKFGQWRNYDPKGLMHWLKEVYLNRGSYYHDLYHIEDVMRSYLDMSTTV